MADDTLTSFYVQAAYAYSGADTASLSFKQGDIIEVLSTLPSGWWDGVICEEKVRGWFPSNYVKRLSDEEAAWVREDMLEWWEGTAAASTMTGEGEDEHEEEEQEEERRKQSARREDRVDSMEDETTRAMAALMRDHGGSVDFSSGADVFSELAATAAKRHSQSQSRIEQSTIVATSEGDYVRRASEDEWLPRMTHEGELFYYNARTNETLREMPINGRGDGMVISRDESDQGERTIDDRARSRSTKGRANSRSSMNSDDSAMEGGSRERAEPHRRPSVAELIAPTSTPLLTHLEVDVMDALRNLMKGVSRDAGQETIDPAREREQLVSLGNATVTAIQTLLHCSGVHEQSTPSFGPSQNEVIGDFPPVNSLPLAAQHELKVFARRVTSTLSKLLLSVRAVWGLLETVPEDRYVDSEEEGGDSEHRRIRERNWIVTKENRLKKELKLRSEILAGARDVQTKTLAFLTELEKVLVESLAGSDQPVIRALLRAPKSLQGALQTNAAALLLTGGGFGGNWRGNGFVTLPAPTSAILDSATRLGTVTRSSLTYSYPSVPLTNDVAKLLSNDSISLLDSVEQLKATVLTLVTVASRSTTDGASTVDSTRDRRISTSSRSSQLSSSSSRRASTVTSLLNRSSLTLAKISSFLARVEEVDIAGNIDLEVVTPVRRGSQESMTAGMEDAPLDLSSIDHRKGIQQAKSLLRQLEVAKQTLYDASASLLTSVQDVYLSTSNRTNSPSVDNTISLLISPLSHSSPPSRIDSGPQSILDVIADLTSAINNICHTFIALGAISESQVTAPKSLRPNGVALRADSTLQRGTSVSSSRRSSVLGHYDDNDEMSPGMIHRDSVDSDFFFPSQSSSNLYASTSMPSIVSPPTTPSSLNARSRGSKTSQLFSQIGGWERRESNATVASSVQSDGLPYRRGYGTSETDMNSPTRSPSKMKLAKLLGSDAASSPRLNLGSVEPTPTWLASDYALDEISFNMEGQVKGGTLRALVIAAASHEGRVDSNYLSAFLMTYRTFCTSHELLDLLVQRFSIEAPMGLVLEDMKVWETRKLRPIRARVANVIKSWVRDYMDHDEADPELLRRISDFASLSMRDPVQSPQILKAVEERMSGAALRLVGNTAPGALPTPILPRSFRKLKFLDIDPLELARQLTIRDGRLFSKITPQECLAKAWPKKFGNHSPAISAMIDTSNAVTRWVAETILAQDDAKKRATTIKHFVTIGERCLALNNFSSVIQILAGLKSSPIHRLKRTWEIISQRTVTSLAHLDRIMARELNYKEYREALRGVTPPCVPFLGVYLTDWTFIGEGNPDMLREKPHQINFQKRQKASELMLMIKLHQSTIYNLAPVPSLTKFLDEQLFPPNINIATDEQRLYEISLQREPREREDEKIARLLSESGFL